jgi:hypothetical protein
MPQVEEPVNERIEARTLIAIPVWRLTMPNRGSLGLYANETRNISIGMSKLEISFVYELNG